jgi:hypothetical protein
VNLVSLKKDKIFALVILDEEDIIYYRIDNGSSNRFLLTLIEEMIFTNEMKEFPKYFPDLSSDYFPALSFLLKETQYRNLSHRQLIDKMMPLILKHNFFALHRHDKIENITEEILSKID